jgi:hypothetical protein
MSFHRRRFSNGFNALFTIFRRLSSCKEGMNIKRDVIGLSIVRQEVESRDSYLDIKI